MRFFKSLKGHLKGPSIFDTKVDRLFISLRPFFGIIKVVKTVAIKIVPPREKDGRICVAEFSFGS